MKWVVLITETLRRSVVVEADSENEAIDRAQAAYDAEEIVLDYGDYGGDVEITGHGSISEEGAQYYYYQIFDKEE